jgi:RAB protein geranylgeranyltransferase component A
MSAFDISILDTIRNKIEKMPKDRHIQALNILAKYQSITINEPKYGNVNINLSCVQKEAVDDLLKFVSYVEDQENALMMAEEQKKIYQEVFFTYENDTPSQQQPQQNHHQQQIGFNA